MTNIHLFILLAGISIFPNRESTVTRIASYNIKNFSTFVINQGERLEKLKTVINTVDADIWTLQEVDNREALRLLFDKKKWEILIDDDSNYHQDVAIVVRKPYKIITGSKNLDADDRDFAFPGRVYNAFFPQRRDLLIARVYIPSADTEITILNVHAKSRQGGRTQNERQRVGASRAIVQYLKKGYDGKNYVLSGDFNDNPDDISLNVLETGEMNPPDAPEENPGPFMINLMEPLMVKGYITCGFDVTYYNEEKIKLIDPDSRRRNNELKSLNEYTGGILYDQILIPVRMIGKYIPASASVFNDEVAIIGDRDTRASDHLPVYADFNFSH